MKKIFVAGLAVCAALAMTQIASADEYVNGYYNHNGHYVEGYHRSDPNNTPDDNYSHKGNINPWTGQPGYKND